MSEDMRYMREAYRQALKSYEIGEVPVGAIVVKDGKIIGRGYNQRESLQDPLAHAEIQAIREASKELASWRLLGSSLYVTLEPCAMCAGAIINSRIERVVIGTRDPKRGCCGTTINLLDMKEFNHRAQVEFGLMEEENSSLISKFFKELRESK